MTVTFIELQGEDAKGKLERLQNELAGNEEVRRTELLQSDQQPELYLLVCRSRVPLALSPPQGAKFWSFQPVSDNA